MTMKSMLNVATVSLLFDKLKQNFGINQAQVADILSISRQKVADMKAGRRRFTRKMGDSLADAFKNEPWGDWLKAVMDTLFAGPETESTFTANLSAAPALDESSPASTPALSPQSRKKPLALPVLTAPWRGDPKDSPNNTPRHVTLPDDLAIQTAEAINPYVLVLDFDSRDGRLRRGDWVLVIQDPDRETEVEIIECHGALRLARRGKHRRLSMPPGDADIPDSAWVLLDSGTVIPGHKAEKTGCVVGIVLALL